MFWLLTCLLVTTFWWKMLCTLLVDMAMIFLAHDFNIFKFQLIYIANHSVYVCGDFFLLCAQLTYKFTWILSNSIFCFRYFERRYYSNDRSEQVDTATIYLICFSVKWLGDFLFCIEIFRANTGINWSLWLICACQATILRDSTTCNISHYGSKLPIGC